MAARTDLHRAFASTNYCVDFDGRTVTLKVNQPPPAPLAAWITRHEGTAPAWLITAHNPGGERLHEAANRAREAALSQTLDRPAIRCLPSVNRDPGGQWPDERGWLIAGLEESRARALARCFHQAAIVAVTADGVALLWTA